MDCIVPKVKASVETDSEQLKSEQQLNFAVKQPLKGIQGAPTCCRPAKVLWDQPECALLAQSCEEGKILLGSDDAIKGE